MRARTGWKRIISPDVKITAIRPFGSKKAKKTHLLKPGELAEVDVHRQWNAPLHSNGRLTMPQVSARSVLARLGVQIGFEQRQLPEFYETGRTPKRLVVWTVGKQPVRLRKGNRVARFYFPHVARPIHGKEIRALRESGRLVLGNDFKVLPSGMLEIQPHRVIWKTSNEAVAALRKEFWASGSKRRKLMAHLRRLQKVPRTAHGELILTETLPVKIPTDHALFLVASSEGTSMHIRSLLIDPGFEGPIVLELLGLRPNVKPEPILAFLAKPE